MQDPLCCPIGFFVSMKKHITSRLLTAQTFAQVSPWMFNLQYSVNMVAGNDEMMACENWNKNGPCGSLLLLA